jgi:Kef-type K+ transport system membrane component KefB
LELFTALLVLLVLTRVLGTAAERLGQPASVGELGAGILLAAAAAWFAGKVPFLAWLMTSEAIDHVANFGIFFLVLLAGVELEPEELRRNSRSAFGVALGGMIVPLLGGLALGWAFLPESGFKQAQAFLIGVAMSISAIPATVKIFEDLGQLHARSGETVVAAAIFDDVFGLLALALLVALIETGHIPDILSLLFLVAKVAVFFAVTLALGVHVYPRVRRGLKIMEAAAMEFSFLVAVGLAYGLLAEALGLHWVLGAFMAGLFFEKSRVGPRTYTEMKMILTAITGGVLGPLFFASIGLRVDLAALVEVPVFVLLLIAVAILGKVAGAGLPALLSGMERREALAVGVGLSARGAVEMVIIGIAQRAGLFAQGDGSSAVVTHLFSALILMAAITTLITPIALRQLLGGRKE